MNRIIKVALAEQREGFSEYLREYCDSSSGYMSFMSSDITDYDDAWARFKRSTGSYKDMRGVNHLIWAVLDYWLFASKGAQKEFDEALWDNVYSAEGNGEFLNIMHYSPVEQNEAVAV